MPEDPPLKPTEGLFARAVTNLMDSRLRTLELRQTLASILAAQSQLGEALDALAGAVEKLEGATPSQATIVCREMLAASKAEIDEALDRIDRTWRFDQ